MYLNFQISHVGIQLARSMQDLTYLECIMK